MNIIDKIKNSKYFQDVPFQFRAWGDALLATGLFALGLDAVHGTKYAVYISIVCIVAKFITNIPSKKND
jgi:hypothetical protein